MTSERQSSSTWARAVKRLLDKTESKAIIWHRTADPRAVRSDAIGDVFYTDFGGNRIVVYRHEARRYTDVDEWEPDEDVRIEFAKVGDASLTSTWRWPRVPGRVDLLDAIGYQGSDGDAWLKSLLEE